MQQTNMKSNSEAPEASAEKAMKTKQGKQNQLKYKVLLVAICTKSRSKLNRRSPDQATFY